MMRFLMSLAVVYASLVLSGCGFSDWSDGSQNVDTVRSEIAARNFGRATELAAVVVEANPNDPAAYFEQARAEALAGNEGRAFRALEMAIELGLPNASVALEDAAFSDLKSSVWFAALRDRASPTPNTSTDYSDHTRIKASPADGVVILELPNGETHIQAGEVSLSTDF